MITISYLLFDAARLQHQIHKAKELNENHFSLYKNRSEADLEDVGPYLFTYKSNTEFSKFFNDAGWGEAWGILLKSNVSFEELFRHFQKFLLVITEDGQELYFRFYDPRVLKIFLPTCSQQQILEFFGPVEYFVVEGETKEEAIIFKQKNGELIEEKIAVSKVSGEVAEDKDTGKLHQGQLSENKQTEVLPEGKKPPRRFIY